MAVLNVKPYAQRETITLASDELWQVEGGAVRFQTGTPTSEADGARLTTDSTTVRFASGQNVTVWLAGGVGASIVRVPVL